MKSNNKSSIVVACLAKIGVLTDKVFNKSVKPNSGTSVSRKVSGVKKHNANERRTKKKIIFKRFVGADRTTVKTIKRSLIGTLRIYDGTKVKDPAEREQVFMRRVIKNLLHFRNDMMGYEHDIMRFAPRNIEELREFYKTCGPGMYRLYQKTVVEAFNYDHVGVLKRKRIENKPCPEEQEYYIY